MPNVDHVRAPQGVVTLTLLLPFFGDSRQRGHEPGGAAARYRWLVGTARAQNGPATWTRGLLSCGLAAGPVFVTAFLIQGATREGYRPSRHPVSSLALGPRGWVQTANFAVTGTLILAGAAGLWRARDPADSAGPVFGTRAGPVLIGAAGVGLIGSAIFITDPVSGYPPGTPDAPAAPTRTGVMHTLGAVPVFVGLPAAAFSYAWRSARTRRRGFALSSAAAAATMLAGAALAGAGFNQSPRWVDRAGWLQRVSIMAGFGWLTALSARALRRSSAIQPL
jgi:hypothetical protein